MQAQLDLVKKAIENTVRDKKNLLFHVVKSTNNNAVLYFYENGVINARWIIIEGDKKPYVKDLDFAENLIMGATITPIENDTLIVSINADTEQKMKVELVMDSSGNPAIITSINNKPSRVVWAYATLTQDTIPLLKNLIIGGITFDGKSVEQELV